MYFLKDPETKVAKKQNIALIGADGWKTFKGKRFRNNIKAIHCYLFIENNVYKL